MKALLVTPSYFPIIGGSETLTQVLATRLNEIGIHASIMTYNMDRKWYVSRKEERKRDGLIDVFRMPGLNPLPGLPNPLVSLLRVNVLPDPIFLTKFRKYDLIHFVGEADLSFPSTSFFIDKPKLMHCIGIYKHGGIYKYYKYQRPYLIKLFRRFFATIADRYLVSTTEEISLLSDLGIPEDKISVIPLGVDINLFRPGVGKKSENLLLFVGRIDRIKGVHILIKALPLIRVPVQVAIIGSKWDSGYVKEIEEMSNDITRKGIHKVVFLGAMSQEEIVPWYQKASILVCPYLYESHSNVVREALACETPVVSTGSHMSKEGADGILLTSKSPKDLAEAVEKLLEDKNLREKYGKEGRGYVERNLSWDSMVKRLVDLYREMLDN
jgi:glycosyltransferase involved in cell wall biosynthesis